MHVPDEARITRHIFYPFMFRDEILDPIFTFQFKFRNGNANRQESLIWRIFIPFDYLIDCLGCLQQHNKNEKKVAEGKDPIVRYRGHRNALCRTIRAIETDKDYRFELIHAPEEGIYHVHVSIVPPVGGTLNDMNKTILNELRHDLFMAFGDLKDHQCESSSLSASRLVGCRWIINSYAYLAGLVLSLRQSLKTS